MILRVRFRNKVPGDRNDAQIDICQLTEGSLPEVDVRIVTGRTFIQDRNLDGLALVCA